MLKFIKHHMTSIGNVEIYPMISFILFFLFFLVVLILVFKRDKAFIAKMEKLPLEDGTAPAIFAETESM